MDCLDMRPAGCARLSSFPSVLPLVWSLVRSAVSVAVAFTTVLDHVVFGDGASVNGYSSNCQPLKYGAAKDYCVGQGSQLATGLRTPAAVKSIVDALGCTSSMSGVQVQYWLGLYYVAGRGYVWANDNTVFDGNGWGSESPYDWDVGFVDTAAVYNSQQNVFLNYQYTWGEFVISSNGIWNVPLCGDPKCSAADCSAAGTQSVNTANTPSSNNCCNCKPRYTGAKCDACASGYHGTDCALEYCSRIGNNCNAQGTAQYSAGNDRPNCCTCKSTYTGTLCDTCASGYHGANCALEYCSRIGNNCHGQGTALYSAGNDRPNCCTCKSTFTGALCDSCASGYSAMPSCADAFCWVAGNTCVTANTASYKPDNLRPGGGGGGSGTYGCCMCKTQYVGNSCETRICHANFDCRGYAIKTTTDNSLRISGTYPNCVCRCMNKYGGRNCRTLSATMTMTRTVTVSVSGSSTATIRPTHTATVSHSGSISGTVTNQPTVSATVTTSLSPTATATPSATQSLVASHTLSGTAATPSPRDSSTISSTLSDWASPTGSIPTTMSPSLSQSASPSHTASPSRGSATLSASRSGPTPSTSRTTTTTLSALSPSASGSFTCPIESFAEKRSLTRLSTWNRDPFSRIDVIRPLLPVVFPRIPGDALKKGAVSPTSSFNASGARPPSHYVGGNASGYVPRMSVVDPSRFHTLVLRSDLWWKGGYLLNITGYLELSRGPDARWQPKGLRHREGLRVVVDYNGDAGALTAHIPLLEGLVVDEEEEAILFVNAVQLFGCGDDGLWLSAASVIIEPQSAGEIHNAAEVVSQVASALGAATDLQVVAMLGLMPCSGGLMSNLASSKASLSPFAVGDEWTDVLLGNGLAIIAALVVSGLCIGVASAYFRRKRRQRWADPANASERGATFADRTGLVAALSLLRLPALLVKGLLYLYAGTLSAMIGSLVAGIESARGAVLYDPLTDPTTDASAPPVFVDAAPALVLGLLALCLVVLGLPIAMVLVSRRCISRGFAKYDYSASALSPDWMAYGPDGAERPAAGRTMGIGQLLAALLLPRGAFLPTTDTTKMFGPLVTNLRHGPCGSEFIVGPPQSAGEECCHEEEDEIDELLASLDEPLPSGASRPRTLRSAAPSRQGRSAGALNSLRGSLVWVTLPMWSCWIAGLGQLILVRDVVLCRTVMGVLSALYFVVALAVLAVRPHAILFSTITAAIGTGLTAIILLCGMFLIGGADEPMVRDALQYAVAAQVAVSAVRTAHVWGVMAWRPMARLWVKRRGASKTKKTSSVGKALSTSPSHDHGGDGLSTNPSGSSTVTATTSDAHSDADDPLGLFVDQRGPASDYFGEGDADADTERKRASATLKSHAEPSDEHEMDDMTLFGGAATAPAAMTAQHRIFSEGIGSGGNNSNPMIFEWFYDVDRRGRRTAAVAGGGIGHRRHRDIVTWLSALTYDDHRSWPRRLRLSLVDPIVEGASWLCGVLCCCCCSSKKGGLPSSSSSSSSLGATELDDLGGSSLHTMQRLMEGGDVDFQQGLLLPSASAGSPSTPRDDDSARGESVTLSSSEGEGRTARQSPSQLPPPTPLRAVESGSTDPPTTPSRLSHHQGYVFRRIEELQRKAEAEAEEARRMAEEEEAFAHGRLRYDNSHSNMAVNPQDAFDNGGITSLLFGDL